MGVGKVYDSGVVDALSRKVGDFAKDTTPVELLGNCFWREGLEAAFGPERRGEKGGVLMDHCYRLVK